MNIWKLFNLGLLSVMYCHHLWLTLTYKVACSLPKYFILFSQKLSFMVSSLCLVLMNSKQKYILWAASFVRVAFKIKLYVTSFRKNNNLNILYIYHSYSSGHAGWYLFLYPIFWNFSQKPKKLPLGTTCY